MNNKLPLLLVTTLFVLFSLMAIGTVLAKPPTPPCLTTDLCFENAVKATNFTSAGDISVGYINGGSNLDFVTTGWTRDKIRIKTGSGDGTFWGTWTWNMGDGTYEVDIADFNGDGHTDIIATNSEQDRVFIRWGHTGWANFSVWSTGNHPHYLATGDLNNDGLDDFATGNTTGNETITVRLRQAAGGFAPATHYPANHSLNDVAFNDCDHDGDLDMFYSAVFNHPYDQEAFVYLRLNDGYGGFSAAEAIDMDSAGYGINIGAIAFGDLDEDGWDDMVVTRNDHMLIRVLGGANCSFTSSVVADVQSNPHSVEFADMNGDSHLDLVVSHSLQQLITIYLGQGNGNVTGPYEPELSLDWHVRDIGTGDFNNDGLMDIVYTEECGVWLLLAREMNSPPWIFPWLILNNMGFAPVGQSRVELIDDRLVISNIGSGGEDGLYALLDSAELWSADIDIEGRVGAQLHFNTITNETNASSLQVNSTRSGMEIRPAFVTANYMIDYQLENQSQLVLTRPSDSQTPAASVNWDEIWCILDLPPNVPSDICRLAFEYGLDPHDLYHWQVDLPVPLRMVAANGNLVTADRIRMIEIPDSQSGANNSFSRLEIRVAAADSLTLSNVMMVSAEPPLYDLLLPMIVR